MNTISSTKFNYTQENLFEQEDVAKRYENFLVEGIEEVPGKFNKIFEFINQKILFPEHLWETNDSIPTITLIDFGIGSGKFTLPHLEYLLKFFETYEIKEKIEILGFDKSEFMLERFKENAKNLLKLENKPGDQFENEKVRWSIFRPDLNDHEDISTDIDDFLNGDSRERLFMICFAQTFHYLSEPEKFIKDIILEKIKKGYLIHYLPTHYLKYLDGNFNENAEEQEFYSSFLKGMDKRINDEHKRLWRFYFSLRDGIRNYTGQKITATNENYVFDCYTKKGFIKIAEKSSDLWRKSLSLEKLIEIIEKPIFSAQNVGLTDSEKENISTKLKIEFGKKRVDLELKAPFGYKAILFYFDKNYAEIPKTRPILKEAQTSGKAEISLEKREMLLEIIKSRFPKLNFYFCGITYVNKFKFDGYESIELSNLTPWEEFLENLKNEKISIAEIIVKEKIKDHILISDIGDHDFKINKHFLKIQIEKYISIFRKKVKKKIPYLKDKDLVLFYFPLYNSDIVEEIFMNFIFTFVLEKAEEDQLDALKDYFKKNWKDVFNKYLQEIRKKFIEYTIKSSVSAIMSRNMSHNIGSHVIADLVSKGTGETTPGELNTFYRYLQNRMDFIAQITTEIPEWTYPAYFNQELMRIFYENFILIDKIGVSEGLKAYDWKEDWRQGCMRSKIIVRTGINRREVRNKHNEKQEDGFKWVINEYHMGELESDLQLAIPGGIVGYHAFYIIIENMIRNSAKHDYATRVSNMLDDKDSEEGKKILIIKNNSIEITTEHPDIKIFDIASTEIKDTELLKRFKAIVIESSCFMENTSIDKNNIRLKNNLNYSIDKLHRIYIACHNEMCDGCAFESDKTWGQASLSYHLLTFSEWEKVENIIKNEDNQTRYDSVLNYLLDIPLRVNIRIDDMKYKDYVWVTVWDDMPQYANYDDYKNANDPRKEVSGEMPEEKIKDRQVIQGEDGINLFGFLNDRLRQSFIKDTGELKKENWGLAELKICAGYLQNRKPEEIGGSGKDIIEYGYDCFNLNPGYVIQDKNNPNDGYPKMIIKAIPVNKTGQEMPKLAPGEIYFLGYRFWMKKPKVVAITGDKQENLEKCSTQGEK